MPHVLREDKVNTRGAEVLQPGGSDDLGERRRQAGSAAGMWRHAVAKARNALVSQALEAFSNLR